MTTDANTTSDLEQRRRREVAEVQAAMRAALARIIKREQQQGRMIGVSVDDLLRREADA